MAAYDLKLIRDLLWPGLNQVVCRYQFLPDQWEALFNPVPAVSIQHAVALGVAAAIIKNPKVTRRFFSPQT